MFGREHRGRPESDNATTGTPDPHVATYLPDWSGDWIATTREQAAGSPSPHPVANTAPTDGGGLIDTAQFTPSDTMPAAVGEPQPSSGGEPEPPPMWPEPGHYAVDLTPLAQLPADAPVSAPVAVDGAPLEPIYEPSVVDGTPIEPVPALAADPAVAEGTPVEPIYALAADPAMVDHVPGAATALPGLPPPVAGSMVLDVPAPEHWDPLPNLEAPPSAAADNVEPLEPLTDAAPSPTAADTVVHWDPLPDLEAPPSTDADAVEPLDALTDEAPMPAVPSSTPLPATPDPENSAGAQQVLDVRDREPTEPTRAAPSQVVLGFGDGTEQQLPSDDPDARAIHELAATLTAAPRHRR
ncbi:MAG TPA: hypothetical protein VIC82_10330 [Candidatus Nanopelagicales bacterium]